MSATVLVPIANGSEEIETVCIVDTLVRAGAKVVVASVEADKQCQRSRCVHMVRDVLVSDVAGENFDCIAVPGGMPGAQTISDNAQFMALLSKHVGEGKLYGAICAAPAVVLQAHGLIPSGAVATSFPAFAEKLENYSEERVVHTGKLVTSRGPGTAIEFALGLSKELVAAGKLDNEKAKSVPVGMLIPPEYVKL